MVQEHKAALVVLDCCGLILEIIMLAAVADQTVNNLLPLVLAVLAVVATELTPMLQAVQRGHQELGAAAVE
jgi:hypothetical protein